MILGELELVMLQRACMLEEIVRRQWLWRRLFLRGFYGW